MKDPGGFPPKPRIPHGLGARPGAQGVGAQGAGAKGGAASRPGIPPRAAARPARPDGYKEFAASELFCPKCQTAMPVREKPLLYLPNGQVSDYRCAKCGSVLGTKRT